MASLEIAAAEAPRDDDIEKRIKIRTTVDRIKLANVLLGTFLVFQSFFSVLGALELSS